MTDDPGKFSFAFLLSAIVLAGKAGGQIETDRYVVVKDETPMANLYLSMLDMLGTPAESIGDSSGRLDDLGVSLSPRGELR